MRRLAIAVLLVAAATVAVVRAPAAEALVPEGFTEETVVTGVPSPTAFAFTPDGRLLVTTQPGDVHVVENDALVETTALSLGTAVCGDRERGLLGITADPDFELNGYLYLFYTANKNGDCMGPVNRLSRFTMTGNTIDPLSELILLDNMPSTSGNHNAGDVQVGPDGHLYVTIGDGGCDYAGGLCDGSNDAARDQHALVGKLLRITRSGGIPPDNPYVGTDADACALVGITSPGRKCLETYAWGFRNPFRLAIDPNSMRPRVHVNDVGQGAFEEVDVITPGGDYGWNCREGSQTNNTTGPCSPTPAGMIDPAFEYRQGVRVPGTSSGTDCRTITGGAFVPNGAWPGAYDNAYLFADFFCGRIFRLTPTSSGYAATDFASLGRFGPVHLGFGPKGTQQALYYATRAGGGSIGRIFPNEAQPYVAVAPARVLDTRPGGLVEDGFNEAVGPDETIEVPVLGRGGVPSFGVGAVVLNVVATNVPQSTFVTVFPRGTARPVASNLNVIRDQTAANLVIAKVGTGGRVSIYNRSGEIDLVADVAGWFPAGTPVYTPTTPLRILDTRPGELDGDGHDEAVPPDTSINVPVGGRGSIPLDASAVVMNVTVTQPSESTYLTVYPGGSTRPLASNVNVREFQTAPNLALAKLGPDGSVDVYNARGTAHVVIDVAGWVPAAATGLVATTPVRILDTRPGELDSDGLNAPIRSISSIEVQVGGQGGVPMNARAVILNVTATNPTTDTFLTVFPTGSRFPPTSNLNVRLAETRPNLVITEMGADGKVTVYNANGTVDVVFDVAGWLP